MSKPINQILCTNLLRLRIMHRYSQREISEVLQISQPSYNKMESGRTVISGERIYQLAKLYNVSVNDFYYENGLFPQSNNSPEDIIILEERLSDTRLINEILIERNRELQEKLNRKDRKINTLLQQTFPVMLKQP